MCVIIYKTFPYSHVVFLLMRRIRGIILWEKSLMKSVTRLHSTCQHLQEVSKFLHTFNIILFSNNHNIFDHKVIERKSSMKSLLIFCLLSLFFWEALSLPKPDREPLQGVKGGIKGGSQHSFQNASVFYGENNQSSLRNISGASSTFKNETVARNYEKGVCYEEVLWVFCLLFLFLI